MLEAKARFKARNVVYDPQSPFGPTIPKEMRGSCRRLAIVLNQHEAAHLGGKGGPERAASVLLARSKADVVVVKCGALGCVVVEPGKRSLWIGAIRTDAVWPIGTGDVFSATFAWHWGHQERPPREAARLASRATAVWSSTRHLPVRRSRTTSRHRHLRSAKPRVYVAGPFFSVQERWLLETVRGALLNLGATVFSPLHDVGRGDEGVAVKDLQALRRCKSMIALLDRADTGTVFEAGYARAQGVKVVGFTESPNAESLKMLRGSGVKMFPDLSTAVYQAVWAGM